MSSRVTAADSLDFAGTTRLLQAIEVARRTGAAVYTSRVVEDGLSSDRAQRRIIDSAGLGARWHVLPGRQRTTREEAVDARAALPGLTDVVVVTSPLHTRRACATFERVGFRVTCVSSRRQEWWKSLYLLLYEQAAWLLYWRNGWLGHSPG